MTVSYAVFRRWRVGALQSGADRLQGCLPVLHGCADDVAECPARLCPDRRGWAADSASRRRRELGRQLREVAEAALGLGRALDRAAVELAELRRLDADLRADAAGCGACLTGAGVVQVSPGAPTLGPPALAALQDRLEALLHRARSLDGDLAAAATQVAAGLDRGSAVGGLGAGADPVCRASGPALSRSAPARSGP